MVVVVVVSLLPSDKPKLSPEAPMRSCTTLAAMSHCRQQRRDALTTLATEPHLDTGGQGLDLAAHAPAPA